jgi:hypothetical protein
VLAYLREVNWGKDSVLMDFSPKSPDIEQERRDIEWSQVWAYFNVESKGGRTFTTMVFSSGGGTTLMLQDELAKRKRQVSRTKRFTRAPKALPPCNKTRVTSEHRDRLHPRAIPGSTHD